MPNFDKDQHDAVVWATKWLNTGFVILDTETTGLNDDSEIVQIAVVSYEGKVLLDTYVMPYEPSKLFMKGKGGKSASDINGITLDHLRDAPTFKYMYRDMLFPLLKNMYVLIYNAPYDLGRLEYCRLRDECLPLPYAGVDDVMLAYSQYIGNWDPSNQRYKWVSLPSRDHSAKGDCLATLALVKGMAGRTI